MEHLHSELTIGKDQVVQVTLRGNSANVVLLDDDNYRRYVEGDTPAHSAGGL